MGLRLLLLFGVCAVLAEANSNVFRGLRCEGRYPAGSRWRRVKEGVVFTCNCMVHEQRAYTHCAQSGNTRPSGGATCRDGHRPGDTWAKTYHGKQYRCTCTGDATRAVTKCKMVQQPTAKCQGYFTHGQQWTITVQGKQLKCRCEVNGNEAKTRCQEAAPERIRHAPKCENRYGHGQQWTRYRDQMPYTCKCTVKGYVAHTNCKADGCKVDGLVYRVGQTFYTNRYGERYRCTCERTDNGTKYGCTPAYGEK